MGSFVLRHLFIRVSIYLLNVHRLIAFLGNLLMIMLTPSQKNLPDWTAHKLSVALQAVQEGCIQDAIYLHAVTEFTPVFTDP